MNKTVVTTKLADAQIVEIDGWWRAHRDKAPDLFEEELTDVLRLISTAPGVGKRYPHPREVRRVMMRRTRHHLYYVEREQYVLVVAVWGSVKGSGPDIRGL